MVSLAGILLVLSILTSLVSGFGGLPAIVPGMLQFVAGILLWKGLPGGFKRVAVILFAVGIASQLVSGQAASWAAALSKNQQIIAMLAAIGLLRHSPQPEVAENSPRGQKALLQTLLGLHWLGSIINISALAIFADRLVKTEGRLNSFEGVMLARSYSLAALWSPFFVAMGMALAYAPGANYRTILLWGLPFSQFLLVGMILHTIHRRREEVSRFCGYPFRPPALIVPGFLAAAVSIGHFLFPAVSIVTLITLLAPCYPLLATRRGYRLNVLSLFVFRDLPRMGPEIVLFISAGILGSGVSSLAAGHAAGLAGEYNHVALLCVGLGVILVASGLGIHPVVGIAAVGGIISTVGISPDLLAVTFLMGWGLGVLINPISGVHLLLSGRYAFPSRNSWGWNFRFVALSYVAGCAWLYMIAEVFG